MFVLTNFEKLQNSIVIIKHKVVEIILAAYQYCLILTKSKKS